MNDLSLEVVFAFGCAIFGIVTALLTVIAVAVAPLVIGKADDALGVLNEEGESRHKGLPLSFGRLTAYGRAVMFQNTQWMQKRVFAHRPDRVHAVESAPPNIKMVVMCIYAPISITGALFFIFGALMLLVGA